MFRRNLGVKVVSLLFAVIFWLFVQNQNTPDNLVSEQTLTIPLVAKGLDQDMVVMTQLPSVLVRFQSINPSSNIKDIYAEIDLSGGVPGESTYVIKVNTTPGMNVVDVRPNSIKLTLDTVEEKTVSVQGIVSGSPADDYQAGSPIITPSAVNIRGPSSILGTLDKVVVEISAAGAQETIQASRPVSFRDKKEKPIFGPNPGMDILSAYPSSVNVVVPILPKDLSSKLVPLRVAGKGTPAKGLELRTLVPSPSSVQIQGPPEAIKHLDSVSLGSVDISGLSEDKTFQIPLEQVALPPGVSFLSGTTLSVIAQVGPGPVEKTISQVPVQIRNIGEGIEIAKPISPINIVIEGLSDATNNVTAEQIQLWVDASGQGIGDYSNIKVYWQLPPGVSMVSTPQVSYSLIPQREKEKNE